MTDTLPEIGTHYQEIKGLYFKVSARRRNGQITFAQPKWFVGEDQPPHHQWAKFPRHVHLEDVSTEEGVKNVLQRLNQMAARQLMQDRQRWEEIREKRRDEEERRELAREQLKRRIRVLFSHYAEEYNAVRPTQITSDPEREEYESFCSWVVRQLTASEAKTLSEHKKELKDKHDLPRHAQLI